MRKLIIALIVLSGIFVYPTIGMINNQIYSQRFTTAQFALFLLSVSLLWAVIIRKFNKWMAYLLILCGIGLFKTMLLQQAPDKSIYESILFGGGIFGIYYAVRLLDLKYDILKYFLIPAFLNIALIIIQAFDHQRFAFLPVAGITGFMGNASVSVCFIALTMPLFIKYCKLAIPLLLLALFLCSSTVAWVIAIVSGVLYLCLDKEQAIYNKMVISILAIMILCGGGLYAFKFHKPEIKHRLSMYAGTLDGIKHNPILGWGVGSFEPIMAQIKPVDSRYFGGQFNYADAFMNHPHNEVLLGWWSLGILFPILFFGLIIDIIRRFSQENILPFAILAGGLIYSMGSFISPPAWFLLAFVLGIYDQGGNDDGE